MILAFSVHAVFHNIGVFFDNLASVHWEFLALAALCQIAKTVCMSRAWRNVLARAYPKESVRGRTIYGAVLAGVGVSSVVPARGGEAVKLVIAKRQIKHSTYTTLASSLLVQSVFDTLVATALFIWLLSLGVLPGHALLPNLPTFDFGWFFAHPREAIYVLGTVSLLLTALVLWAVSAIVEFRDQFRQGLAALLDYRYYFRRVVPWQVGDWALRILTLFFALAAFRIPATAYNAFLAQATSSLSTLLPITPSGIGTEQALLTSVFRGVAPATTVLSFSVGTRLTVIAINVIFGFAAILVFFRTFRYQRFVPGKRTEKRPRPV